MRRAWVIGGLLAGLAGAGAVGVWRFATPTPAEKPFAWPEGRVFDLRKRLVEQEVELGLAVETYRPREFGRIDDVKTPAADLLRRLPGVARVDVEVAAERPAGRVIHIRESRPIAKDFYVTEMNTSLGGDVAAADLERVYQTHLLEMELVQQEQMALLRCLIRHHGLTRVMAGEDLPEEPGAVRKKIAALPAAGEGRQRGLLELGAAGRLFMAGELREMVTFGDSAEDPATGTPRMPGPVNVSVLTDSQNFAARGRRYPGKFEYLLVTPKRFSEPKK